VDSQASDARQLRIVVVGIGAEFSFGRADCFESRQGQGRRVVLGGRYDLCPGPGGNRVPVRLAAAIVKELCARR